jgi:hypothetical protein
VHAICFDVDGKVIIGIWLCIYSNFGQCKSGNEIERYKAKKEEDKA